MNKAIFFVLVLAILVVGCTTKVVEETEEIPSEEQTQEETPVVQEEAPAEEVPEEALAEETTEAEEEAEAPSVNEVIIDFKKIEPEELTISKGETITWRKIDDRPHRLIENNGLFQSGDLLYTGNTFSFTFEEAGTYEYMDKPFAASGKIIVE